MNAHREHQPYFVIAALVAAELYKAMHVARQITLIASNARALSQRAGHRAAGFRALTGFIDELANKTVKSSDHINALAIATSRTAISTVNGETSLARFNHAYRIAKDAPFLDSLNEATHAIRSQSETLRFDFQKNVWQLTNALEELARELRSATVLAAMSRVEAIAAGKEFQQSLQVIADNVSEAADRIQAHVKHSQQMISNLQ